MLRTIIVDDEPKNVRILTKLLTDYCSDVKIIATAGNATEAAEIIEEIKPDLVFLDIEMPNGNAFDLLDKFATINFQIIFITAFESYSLKAFKYSALDYLLKPVSIEELQHAVEKAKSNAQNKDINLQVKSLLQNVGKSNGGKQKIALHTLDGLEFVLLEEIIRLEAKGSYTVFSINNKKQIIASKSIRFYEEILSEEIFFRVHNSHIINLDFIKKYHKGRGGYIELEDGTNIEVATRRKNDFLARFEGM
jgi:two-component system, LytTR family, response regulator